MKPTEAANRHRRVRDLANLGDITLEGLRDTFPQWRIFHHSGAWWAMREGIEKLTGPQSLIQRVHAAQDLTILAEKLCLQEYLDSLEPEELTAVYRNRALPGATG